MFDIHRGPRLEAQDVEWMFADVLHRSSIDPALDTWSVHDRTESLHGQGGRHRCRLQAPPVDVDHLRGRPSSCNRLAAVNLP